MGDVYARTMLRIPCGGIDDERNVEELLFLIRGACVAAPR